ncbi:MAG: T9SS type A sorting domain-containing protein [Chitinophagales bacterium]
MNNLKITFVNLFIASLLFVGYLTANAQTVDVRFGNNTVDCSGVVPQFCLNIEIKSGAGAGPLTVGNCNFYGQYSELALGYSGNYTELGFNTGLYPTDHNDFTGFGFISIAWIYDNGEANAISIDENTWSPVGQLCFDVVDATVDAALVLDPFLNLSVRNGGNTVTYTNNYPDGANFSPSLDCPTASCAITGVSATTATCNGTAATFDVSFTAANGSGSYNVVDANGTVWATGATSPLSVSVPNAAGGSVDVNVVDAADATCMSTTVNVALPDCQPTPCAITGVSATTATCNGTAATFDVSFTAANGSGSYNVVDANGTVWATGATSPLSVSVPNAAGGSVDVNVVDAADATCMSTTVNVALPDCQPTPCAITGVSATTATCNGTAATFDVSFTAANGSGSYNVVDANGTVWATGATSPLSVSVPNAAGGSVDVNVVDVADATCMGTTVNVALPDCQPAPCTISIDSVTPECNTDGTYNLTVNVSYSNEPTGLMEIEVGGNSLGTITAGQTSGMVSNLVADGETGVDVVVTFVSDATCSSTAVTYDEPTCNVTPVCTISNVAATMAMCVDDTNASFEVSFTATDASGMYNVVDANGNVLANGAMSPIMVTVAGDGSTIAANVVDAADATCMGMAVDVVLPMCEPAPVCAIVDVAATMAMCAGTAATFEVSFTATNGSGMYNVVDENGTVWASGDSSPIMVTIADATGGDVSINVVDAADAICMGMAVMVTLPDCSVVTPVCAISNVAATMAMCVDDTNASFEVSFTATDASGMYNVVDANGNVLANGAMSPIMVTVAGDGSTIAANVVDAADATCMGMAVDVVLPMCEPAPVCAIVDVAATMAMCAGTAATFEVSFTATNGSGMYNVVDENGTVWASGDSSPIMVTIADATGGDVSINVVDAADAICMGMAVMVTLPDCSVVTPVCAISNVAATMAMCVDDTNASFEVSFTATDASGMYNVVDENGTVWASGDSSPIMVMAAGNGSTISVNVVDATDATCMGMAVMVTLPVCEPNPACASFALSTGVSGSVCTGEMLMASIVATGGNLPYTVQWQANGNNLSGENDDAVMITTTTVDNCLAEGLVLSAIVMCDGNVTTIDAGNVQIFPEPQTPTTSYDVATCTTTISDACSGNTIETYTATAGDAATTISVSVNGTSCGNSSFDIAIPACEDDVVECTDPADASVMTPASAFCEEDAGTMYDLMQLVTGDMNGAWSSTDPDDVMNNMFIVPSNQGNAILTYTVMGVPPCADASTTITVMIDDCNAPPVLTPILLNVSIGAGSVSFNALEGASDPNNDAFSLADVQSTNGDILISFAPDGTVTIDNIPANFTGAINLTYTVTDGMEASTGTIEILVSDCLAQAGIIGDPNSDKPDAFSCSEDNNVSFAATNFNSDFTQAYVLTLNGIILQVSVNGVFENPEPGEYQVYAINYDPALPTPFDLNGAIEPLINGSVDGCYDVAGPALLVSLTPVVVEWEAYCPEDPTVDGYGVYLVDVCVSGGFPSYSGFGAYAINFPPYNLVFNSDNGNCAFATLQTTQGDLLGVPNGACFLIDIESDGLLCSVGSIQVCGPICPEEPDCDPIPGTINDAFVCAGNDVTMVAVSAEIKDDEVGTYILHDGDINNMLAVSSTGTFNAEAIGLACGTTPYYVSFVVGQADEAVDGMPNLDDAECTAISDAAAVYFLCELEVTYNIVENDSEENFSIIIQGVTGGYTTDGMYDVDSNVSFVGEVAGNTSTIIGPLACGVEIELTFSDDIGCSTTIFENVDCKPTPIELIHFSGEVQEEGNLLKWITATEINNNYFTMYRSADGTTFEAIGTKEGAGNSTTAIAYELMDKTAPSGLSYYRLDQTDFDGTTTSSNIISLVRGEQSFGLIELLPVPAIDFVTVRFTSATKADVNLAVYNVAGALVGTQVVEAQNGINALQLDVANYPNGVYFLSLNNGEEVVNVKFIKD